MLRFSGLLIWAMRTLVYLTERNRCFARRREVLGNATLRRRVYDALGGAPAMLKWRRQDAWNKARLDAIARGQVTPECAPKAPRPALGRAGPETPVSPSVRPLFMQTGPALLPEFRLPVLQNLRGRAPAVQSVFKRRAGAPRRLCTVLWPHELDGQYAPDFHSRASRPGSGYGDYTAPHTGAVMGSAIVAGAAGGNAVRDRAPP